MTHRQKNAIRKHKKIKRCERTIPTAGGRDCGIHANKTLVRDAEEKFFCDRHLEETYVGWLSELVYGDKVEVL